MAVLLEKYYHSSPHNPTNQEINEYALRFKGDKDGKVHKQEFYQVLNQINEERQNVIDTKGNANKKSQQYEEHCHKEECHP